MQGNADYTPLGVITWNQKWHGAESTPFRFHGEMFMMESVEGWPKSDPPPWKESHGRRVVLPDHGAEERGGGA